ncbi:cation-independent mannose-6-phosphate receptor-like, partial [Tubulanus polymorphus]|uniref:cation-independent mannose-6-phosphate receptor-like n=1 Tax=Tubulanus polymorphus TaxID=672921 RepID=UPI003DA25B94
CNDDKTAVCKINDGKASKIGNHTNSYNVTSNSGLHTVHIVGAPCKKHPNLFSRTIIVFACGKTLGSPEFLDEYHCETYFQWYTTTVCNSSPFKGLKQTPCTVYADNGNKHNLIPLTKLIGGYEVETANNKDIYINICRDITQNGATQSCPVSSGACLKVNDKSYDIGEPSSPLTIETDGRLKLIYETKDETERPAGCTSKSKTIIYFLCPKRGGGRSPILTSDQNCLFEIEWETEFACPENTLVSHSCKMSSDTHGLDIDISPLKLDYGSYHTSVPVDSNPGSGNYTYYMNVCGELKMQCPTTVRQGMTGCQKKNKDSMFGKSLGLLHHQKLRYSDGVLSLTYTGGDVCSSGLHRTTIITFQCNKSAGVGSPVLADVEDRCTYLFNWKSKYACPAHPLPTQCRVDLPNKHFDLGSLRKVTGDNWEVLFNKPATNGDRYFLNMCGDVLKTGVTSNCPEGAAVCKISNGKAFNLGSYEESPTFNAATKSLKLRYTGGGKCGNGNSTSTVITFYCKLGDMESGPKLRQVSNYDCLYELEWYTAAACVLGKRLGTDCKVVDNDAGFNFDLSHLTLKGSSYTISTDKYDYYLNVCGPVDNNPKCTDSPGICQVPKGSSSGYNLGKPSNSVIYYDGMLNLTYTGGTPYSDTAHTPRKSQITFLCDPTASPGKPKFIAESEHTYSFQWYTKYVCPEQTLECTVDDTKTGKQYDLSSLSLSADKENWALMDTRNHRKFYINVCRPVNPVGSAKNCDSLAGACMATFENNQEKISVANAGRPARPKIDQNGDPYLEYTSGLQCSSSVNKTAYVTRIDLSCKKGALSTSPVFVSASSDNCEFNFLWQTEAACPIENVMSKADDCTLKDPKSNFEFNLKPLTLKDGNGYDVESLDKTKKFKLNICGAVKSCGKVQNKDASVCLVGNTGSNKALGMINKTIHYSDGDLVLKYVGNLDVSTGVVTIVKITFRCDKDVPLGKPRFIKKSNYVYEFEFVTSLACSPAPVDCTVTDQFGDEYDLKALSKRTDNWIIPDNRPSHTDLRYEINICRPVNPHQGSNCPGGPIGGCQTSTTSKTSYNMGYIQSKPHAAGNGTIILRYLNGSPCHMNTEKATRRSTKIIFYCSDTESDPSFGGESEDCEYTFNWRTPRACSIKRVKGNDCKVTDPLYHREFDLSDLKKKSGDYSVSGNGYVFLLNVCGPLNTGTGVCAGAGVCQTKTSQNLIINAGKSSSAVTYEDGVLGLEYVNGKANCHGKYERRTIIKFQCDHSTSGLTGPTYKEERGDCTYVFEWFTSNACPPFKIGSCSLTATDGKFYDLSELVKTRDNYVSTQLAGDKYVINVCSSIVHTKGILCPPNAASCLIHRDVTSNKTTYTNLGEYNDHMLSVTSNGILRLTYINGEKCSTGKTRKTVIDLICSKQGAEAAEPQYSHQENNCEYYFTWSTPHACPKHKQLQQGSDCTVKNPETGHVFDLSSLEKSSGYTAPDGIGSTMKINICKPLVSSPCGEKSGACLIGGSGTHSNSGNVNSKLQYYGGVLTLNYTGGDTCSPDHKHPRNTIISFVCNHANIGTPQYIDSDKDECTSRLYWHTNLACEKKIECTVTDGDNTYDLSLLTKSLGNYNVLPEAKHKDPKAVFFLNICKPILMRGTPCPANAAVCRASSGEKPQSLGSFVSKPSIVNGKVTLEYKNGKKCSSDPSKTAVSTITFTCERGATTKEPVLEAIIDDCHYLFTWSTNIVCPQRETIVTPTTDCMFYDPVMAYTYDLSTLTKPSGQNYEVPADVGKFQINVCDSVRGSSTCSKSGVCLKDSANNEISFGSFQQKVVEVEREKIKLSYKKGSSCGPGNIERESIILFECDPDVSDGAPVLLEKSSCSVTFLWKTARVCPPVSESCSFNHMGKTYDLSLLSRNTGSWNFTDSHGNKYWMNICQGIHGQPLHKNCAPNSAVCQQRPDGTVNSLGKINTQILSVNSEFVVVKYNQGNDACAGGSGTDHNNIAASTVIEFECAKTVGRPFAKPRRVDSNTCEYNFSWKSSIACRLQRQRVIESNGAIKDPKSQAIIYLKSLESTQVVKRVHGSIVYNYIINLQGKMDVTECNGAAICEKNVAKNAYKNIGSYNTRVYYMEDDELQAEFMTDSPCEHDPSKKTRTIIVFHCQLNQSSVSFNYNSKCEYVFDWFTPVVCVSPEVIIKSGDNGVSSSKTSAEQNVKSSTVWTVIAVFGGVICLCVLLIVFHKKERRAVFVSSMRSCFRRGRSRTIRYSRLTELDGADEVLISDTLFDEEDIEVLGADEVTDDNDRTRTNSGLRVINSSSSETADNNVISFHDDSDEDLLE